MAQVRGRSLTLPIILALVLMLLPVLIVNTALNAGAANSTSCSWTASDESMFMKLLSASYGEWIRNYTLVSNSLVNINEAPPICTFRLILRDNGTKAEIEFHAYKEFGKIIGFSLRTLPPKISPTTDLGQIYDGEVAKIPSEALQKIDALLSRILSVARVPDLGALSLSLSKAALAGGLELGAKPVKPGDMFKDFRQLIRIGGGIDADVYYRWDNTGHQHLSIEIVKEYNVGLNLSVTHRLLSVSLDTYSGSWVLTSFSYSPFHITHKEVPEPPSYYIKAVEEAVQQNFKGCTIVSTSLENVFYPNSPKLVGEDTIYYDQPKYEYLVSIECEGQRQGVQVLVNALTGEVYDMSVFGIKSPGNSSSEPLTSVVTGYVPYIALGLSITALAVAVLRRKGSF